MGNSRNGEANRDRMARSRNWLTTTVRVLVLFALVLVAVRIVADTTGQNLAVSDPDGALPLAPWEPIALDELAQRQLTSNSGELSSVEELSRRALLSDPLDSRSLSSLGFVAERKGDLARAEALMSLSAARSWRNPPPHVWLFAQAIRRGKFDEAIAHADGLLRLDWQNEASIFPILAVFGIDPHGLAALEGTLAANPPWRRSFLGQVVNGTNDRLMTQLYQSLIRSSQPPSALEMQPYLDRLILLGRFEEAYQAWRATSSPAETLARYPYNGNFEAPVDGLPFNWVFDDVSRAEIQITAAPDRGNSHALRVQFSGARAHLGRVGQLLMLAPGNYRLELAGKASGLRTERGLVWQTSCAESGVVLTETNPMMGTAPWTDLKVKLRVPSSGCHAQWLKLIIPARTASETEIDGEGWFQNFRITAEAQ
jgi:tetratricopeptide (TPR) repeat protein